MNMQNKQNGIQHQNDILSFEFDLQGNNLIINAQTYHALYSAHLSLNPLIVFERIQEMLQLKEYKILQQNHQSMKIQIAKILELNFLRKDQIIADQFMHVIKKLQQKLQNEFQKNHQFSQTISNQQTQIQQLQGQISTFNQLLQNLLLTTDSLKQQLKHIQTAPKHHHTESDNHYQLSQTVNCLRDTVSKNFTECQDQLSAFNNQHSESISGIRKDLQQHQTKQEEKNNENAQKFEKISRNIGQLRNGMLGKGQIEQTSQVSLQKFEGLKQSNESSEFSESIDQRTKIINKCQKIAHQNLPKYFSQYDEDFFKGSKIVRSTQEKTTLRNFFTNDIQRVNLLYRASDNGFCTEKFHDKCDGIENTLTVIWTEFDKKIGGYNPLKWSRTKNILAYDKCYQGISFNKQGPFLFSLSHSDKFHLSDPKQAIYNDQSRGPVFGWRSLIVCDKGNQNWNNQANLNVQYSNQKYKRDNMQSWKRFHGSSESKYFKIREWEVWELE